MSTPYVPTLQSRMPATRETGKVTERMWRLTSSLSTALTAWRRDDRWEKEVTPAEVCVALAWQIRNRATFAGVQLSEESAVAAQALYEQIMAWAPTVTPAAFFNAMACVLVDHGKTILAQEDEFNAALQAAEPNKETVQ